MGPKEKRVAVPFKIFSSRISCNKNRELISPEGFRTIKWNFLCNSRIRKFWSMKHPSMNKLFLHAFNSIKLMARLWSIARQENDLLTWTPKHQNIFLCNFVLMLWSSLALSTFRPHKRFWLRNEKKSKLHKNVWSRAAWKDSVSQHDDFMAFFASVSKISSNVRSML